MSRRPIVPGIHTGREGDAPPTELDRHFREAMSRWPSGVTVVAVRDEGRIHGITVSAFSSLSREPPLVLACIGEQAGILGDLVEGAVFGVSILTAAQRRLASAFARFVPVEVDRFHPGDAPTLRDAAAGLACTVESVLPGGDHRIVVGQVHEVVLGPDEEPLVHHRRDYRTLQP
jgi:flavin reductase (NADH)